MKSSFADIMEQLDLLESHRGVTFPLPSSSVSSVFGGGSGGCTGAFCGGDCCLGVSRLQNGTLGMSKSASTALGVCLQLSTNAPTLIVSLSDAVLSSLQIK